MDIHNPFEEPVKPAPGLEYSRFAGELASFVHYIGGPKLDEQALSVIIADFFAWLKH